MRVLLISDNRCRESIMPYPLGIACVASAAVQAGHEVTGLDLMFSGDPAGDTARAVRSSEPQCIGLSVRNIDNQDMHDPDFYLPQVREVVRAIRSETEAPVVMGGAGFTIFPLESLDYLDLEMGIVGEGERTFVELLRRMEKGAGVDDLPGLALRRGGNCRVNPFGPHAWPGLFPPPERYIFDVRPYDWIPGKTPPHAANLQSRRGCNMRCIYCSTPRIEGTLMRVRPAHEVADELASLERDYGIHTAIFADSLFDYPPDYTAELCREIKARRLSLNWYCSLNPLYTGMELLELIREAGCRSMSIGNESGSEDILQSLKKGFSKKDVVRAVSGAKSLGFHVNCFLLLGGPGENERTVKESVELMDELDPDMVRATVGIRIYHGCELEEIALREGVISPDQNILYPTFYISRDTESWLHDYMLEVCSARDGWLVT
ncbi:MAG: B12-binding domain-containing radical SAM protein [Actinomycetota bacterium]